MSPSGGAAPSGGAVSSGAAVSRAPPLPTLSARALRAVTAIAVRIQREPGKFARLSAALDALDAGSVPAATEARPVRSLRPAASPAA